MALINLEKVLATEPSTAWHRRKDANLTKKILFLIGQKQLFFTKDIRDKLNKECPLK